MVTGVLFETDCTISWDEALNSIIALTADAKSSAAEEPVGHKKI